MTMRVLIILCLAAQLFPRCGGRHFRPAGIRCNVAYGQKGKLAKNGIGWEKECIYSKYCFEAETSDINTVKQLIDYPWVSHHTLLSQLFTLRLPHSMHDARLTPQPHPRTKHSATQSPYYTQFYVRGCGGDFGTPYDIHPFRTGTDRKNPAEFILNLTTPMDISGHGGTGQFRLKYMCRSDMCSGKIVFRRS